jgi:hypothetical protein
VEGAIVKAVIEVKLTVSVDSDEVSRGELLGIVKDIASISQLYSIPSVDRDSIKLESIEVK